MELQAVTGQRYIGDDGPREADSIPGLLATPAPSQAARGRQKDFLFIHLALGGPPEENGVLTQDLVDSISTLFYRTPGSVTAALRNAINRSNQKLLHYNVSGAGTPREGALTCAVLRGEELFVVQVGEAFALLGHNFGIERLPPAEPEKLTPLGRTAGLDLRYTHNWLQPGDMLLLADPRLSHLPTTAFESALIDVDVGDGLQELSQIAQDVRARVILVEFTDETPDYSTDTGPVRSSSGRQLPPPTATPVREGQSSTAPEAAAVAVGHGLDVEVVETKARKATSRAALGLSGLTAWLADLLALIHSPNNEPSESQSWVVPTVLAVVIPIVVALVVGAVYIQRGNVLRLGEIKDEMRQMMVQARQTDDSQEAQRMFQEVIRLANEASELRPDDSEAVIVREAAVRALDDMAGIARLQGHLLQSYDDGATLQSITLEGDSDTILYVLDAQGNRVFRHEADSTLAADTSPEPETVLFGDQVIGSHVTGQLLDTKWRPQGNNTERDGLTVLDGRGALITYYPNLGDVRAVPLGLSSEWLTPSKITYFGERLYVLDPGAGVIWRYFPDGEGFNVSEGQRFIELPEEAEVAKVIDFAIVSRDGSVILLYSDGRMRHYAGDTLLWSEDDLAASGLDTPMAAPVAVKIVGSGLNSSIFVADPGSDRVLQFSLGGTFLAQYKAIDELGQELFARANDFAVVENPLRIFVVADDDLYSSSRN